MLKESAVEKVMLCIFNSTTMQRGVSVIFFKNKSRFRELHPVLSRYVIFEYIIYLALISYCFAVR